MKKKYLKKLKETEKAYRFENNLGKLDMCYMINNTYTKMNLVHIQPKDEFRDGYQLITFFDFMIFLNEPSEENVYFNENETAFVFIKENKCVITPKTKRAS